MKKRKGGGARQRKVTEIKFAPATPLPVANDLTAQEYRLKVMAPSVLELQLQQENARLERALSEEQALAAIRLLESVADGEADSPVGVDAARRLLSIAHRSTLGLLALVRSQNKGVAEIARDAAVWPALISMREEITAAMSPIPPKLKPGSRRKRVTGLSYIDLGGGKLRVDRSSRWDGTSEAGAIALALYQRRERVLGLAARMKGGRPDDFTRERDALGDDVALLDDAGFLADQSEKLAPYQQLFDRDWLKKKLGKKEKGRKGELSWGQKKNIAWKAVARTLKAMLK